MFDTEKAKKWLKDHKNTIIWLGLVTGSLYAVHRSAYNTGYARGMVIGEERVMNALMNAATDVANKEE